MKVLPPLTITDALLTSSTVVETAPSAYAGGTTYAAGNTASVAGSAGLITVYESLQDGNTGNAPASSPAWWVSIGETYQVYSGAATYAIDDRVIDATAHKVYESVIGGNVGNALADTTKWLLVGPTNKWAMFDLLRNTASIQPSSLTAVVTPVIRVNSLALLGLVADSLSVTVTSDGVTVYTHTEDLNTREVFNWYDYFFLPFSTKEAVVLFDLPPYSNAVITIVLTRVSGNVECGACAFGNYVDLGQVQAEAESDVENFSTVTRDFDGGVSVMVQRRNVPKTIQAIWMPKSQVNRARALRDSLNGTPAIWAWLDDDSNDYFDAGLINGFYTRFTMNHKFADYTILSLDLMEI